MPHRQLPEAQLAQVQQLVDARQGQLQPQEADQLKAFRLLYPVGSRKWNCRAAAHKRATLLGAYTDNTTVLAWRRPNGWLELQLPSGETGWCKQFDEAHMVAHHNVRTGYG